MAVDMTAKKANYATEIQVIASKIMAVARLCDEMDASYFANAFNGGAANQFVQGDLVGGNSHLTPAIITNVITVVEAIKTAMTQGARDNLRQALVDPLG